VSTWLYLRKEPWAKISGTSSICPATEKFWEHSGGWESFGKLCRTTGRVYGRSGGFGVLMEYVPVTEEAMRATIRDVAGQAKKQIGLASDKEWAASQAASLECLLKPEHISKVLEKVLEQQSKRTEFV
jgi:hypothetical protein